MEKSLKHNRNKSGKQKLKELNNYCDAFDRLHVPLQGSMFETEDADVISGFETALDKIQFKQWNNAQHNYQDTLYGQEIHTLYTDQQRSIQTINPLIMAKVEKLFNKFPTQWKVLQMYYFDKLVESEIAKRMDMKQQNVNKSINRGLARIQKYLTSREWTSIQWLFNHASFISPTTANSDEKLARWKRHNKLKRKPGNVQLGISFIKNGERKYLSMCSWDFAFGDGTESYEWLNEIHPTYEATLLPLKSFNELPTPQNFKQTDISYRGINPNGKTFYEPLEKVEIIKNIIRIDA
ncbi:sigma-70 family RNA polymerase sigma factor [Bacillus sp. AFS088145]|uniref:sigma-70 family RNA polymerase sigma factor n=1 Tax=Bacillus sp. AFS088145 TaxID=2033514 RepID=UPI000BF3A3BB|nr:sigma-70 family RNA polymerase sigma factor [Bacillus sp. AFS088145]PFH83608.1 hypothetical protein COI44_17530 [Bacillus sp. AFS088145]